MKNYQGNKFIDTIAGILLLSAMVVFLFAAKNENFIAGISSVFAFGIAMKLLSLETKPVVITNYRSVFPNHKVKHVYSIRLFKLLYFFKGYRITGAHKEVDIRHFNDVSTRLKHKLLADEHES